MNVLLIRHGAAEDQAEFAKTGQADEKRPLTDAGVAQMREAARGLAATVKEIAVIASSPLTRALQTADIVAEYFSAASRERLDAMVPGASYADFISWLIARREAEWVAAVGHEPHISGLASWLLGCDRAILDMKKGSALLIDFERDPRAGAGRLRWFLTPAQMRKLGDQ